METLDKSKTKIDTLNSLDTEIKSKNLNSYVSETIDYVFKNIQSRKWIWDSLIEKKSSKDIQNNNWDFRILWKFSIIWQWIFFKWLNPLITEKVDLDKLHNMNKLWFDNKKLVDELNLAYKNKMKEQIWSLESNISKILWNVEHSSKFFLSNTHVSLPWGWMDLYEIHLWKKEESFMDWFKRKKVVDSYLISAITLAYGIKPEDFVWMLNERVK